MGSTFVTFTTSPLILSFPAINRSCVLTLFKTISPNSISESKKIAKGILSVLRAVLDLHLLTSRLVAWTLPNFTRFLEIDVPTVGLAGNIGQHKGKDGVALFDGITAFHLAGIQRMLDCVEKDRGRKAGCKNDLMLMSLPLNRGGKCNRIWLKLSWGTNGSLETF